MTRRSLITGLLLAVCANVWPVYSSMVVRSSRADFAHLSIAFLVPFVLILIANPVARRHRLSPRELIFVACLGLVAATIQGEWLSGYFLGIISAPTYFASPQNRWAELILPQIPSWSIVSDPYTARVFYEGLPPGSSIPWDGWIAPLASWGPFLLAIMTFNFSLSVLIRKQWVEHERLSFPVATVLTNLVEQSGRGSLHECVRSRLFWLSFAGLLVVYLWNFLTWFNTSLPPLNLMSQWNIPLGRDFPALWILNQPMTMALGYFTKSDVLFSIWFFHLLAIVQVGIFNRLGVSVGGSDLWCSMDPTIGWQSFGSMIVFVAWGIWMGRTHLAAAFRQAVTGENLIDDSGEVTSYRTAVILLAVSGTFGIFFLWQLGMGALGLAFFWFATLVIYLGLGRIMAESGLVFLRGPLSAQAFTWHTLGTAGLGSKGAVAVALTYAFFADGKTLAMTTMAHIPRLGQHLERKDRRRLGPALFSAIILGATATIGTTIVLGNEWIGSFNFGINSFDGTWDGASGIYDVSASRLIVDAFGTDWRRVRYLGIGSLFTVAIILLRYHFPGFRLHPIGFAISSSTVLRSSFFSIFVIWIVKLILFRIGGLDLYRRAVPLFIGLLLGQITGVMLGVVVDTIWFNGNGHFLNRW